MFSIALGWGIVNLCSLGNIALITAFMNEYFYFGVLVYETNSKGDFYMTNKFRVQEEVGERFYRLPKIFFTSDFYKKMSIDAKIAFAHLQDRLELSIRNQWFDEDGYIYFLFGNEQLSEILNCSKPTVIKIKKELQ